MTTPYNAPYKRQQREFRSRVANRGRYIPAEHEIEWDREWRRWIIKNRAWRRKEGLV